MKWTLAEDEQLRALAAKRMSQSEIALAMNKTKGQINGRGDRLGITWAGSHKPRTPRIDPRLTHMPRSSRAGHHFTAAPKSHLPPLPLATIAVAGITLKQLMAGR